MDQNNNIDLQVRSILTYGIIKKDNLLGLSKNNKDKHVIVTNTFVRKKKEDGCKLIEYERTEIPIITAFIPENNLEIFMNKINKIPNDQKIFVSFYSEYYYINNKLISTGKPNYKGTIFVNKIIEEYYNELNNKKNIPQ
jgi:hypothetical protein